MRFSFDGREVPFIPGQTVGAALAAVGTLVLRRTRIQDRPRAMFCGIGACFDCLVGVDGVASQRACLVIARDGMTVQSQEGAGHNDLAIIDM